MSSELMATQAEQLVEVACVCVLDWEECTSIGDGGLQLPPRLRKARYCISQLKSVLQLMGCKTQVAHKASKGVFRMLQDVLHSHRQQCQRASPQEAISLFDFSPSLSAPASSAPHQRCPEGQPPWLSSKQREAGLTYESFPAASSLALSPADVAYQEDGGAVLFLQRETWEALVMEQVANLTDRVLLNGDFGLASSVREQRRSVTILLAGTSGTGKSTLAGLLAARLGITTVISTDSLRHLLRSFTPREASPVLWASTYEAGEVVLARQAAQQQQQQSVAGGMPAGAPEGKPADAPEGIPMDASEAAVKGYKEQSEMVAQSLEVLVEGCERRGESLVVEGVHLSLNAVLRLMRRHASIVPFLVHISNEAKHRERFAVRAKYMALEPAENRYVAHLKSIRTIQEYLVRRATRHAVPALDNTNIDRSVATLHATVMGCLRRQARGEVLLDPGGKTCSAVLEEYAKCRDEATWSSKGMLQLITARRSKGTDPLVLSAAQVERWRENPSCDLPSTSASSTVGPLSETGDSLSGMSWDGGRSFFALEDADLVSSDDELPPCDTAAQGKGAEEAEEGDLNSTLSAMEGSVSHLDYEERSTPNSDEEEEDGEEEEGVQEEEKDLLKAQSKGGNHLMKYFKGKSRAGLG